MDFERQQTTLLLDQEKEMIDLLKKHIGRFQALNEASEKEPSQSTDDKEKTSDQSKETDEEKDSE